MDREEETQTTFLYRTMNISRKWSDYTHREEQFYYRQYNNNYNKIWTVKHKKRTKAIWTACMNRVQDSS